ncbi:MAG: hypothetical protein NC453_17180 [Muribaculum sp.]|nr:hypothetical protein [Muribaculum sp.]
MAIVTMSFWSFIRDMFVFDWLFGHRKKESFWGHRQRESQLYADHSNHDDHNGGYSNYSHNDYIQQDFDDDLDSGMFDDDF